MPWSSPLGGGKAAAQLVPDNTFDGNGLKVEVAERGLRFMGRTPRGRAALADPVADQREAQEVQGCWPN